MWLTLASLEHSHVNLWIPVVLRRIFTTVAFPVHEGLHAVVHSSTSRKPRQGHQHLKPRYWHKGTPTDWTVLLVTSILQKGRRTKAIWDEFFWSMKKRHSERNASLKALCSDIPRSVILRSSNESLNYWGQDWMQAAGLAMLLTEADNII